MEVQLQYMFSLALFLNKNPILVHLNAFLTKTGYATWILCANSVDFVAVYLLSNNSIISCINSSHTITPLRLLSYCVGGS